MLSFEQQALMRKQMQAEDECRRTVERERTEGRDKDPSLVPPALPTAAANARQFKHVASRLLEPRRSLAHTRDVPAATSASSTQRRPSHHRASSLTSADSASTSSAAAASSSTAARPPLTRSLSNLDGASRSGGRGVSSRLYDETAIARAAFFRKHPEHHPLFHANRADSSAGWFTLGGSAAPPLPQLDQPFQPRLPHVSVAHAPTASQLAKVAPPLKGSRRDHEERQRYMSHADQRREATAQEHAARHAQELYLATQEAAIVHDLQRKAESAESSRDGSRKHSRTASAELLAADSAAASAASAHTRDAPSAPIAIASSRVHQSGRDRTSLSPRRALLQRIQDRVQLNEFRLMQLSRVGEPKTSVAPSSSDGSRNKQLRAEPEMARSLAAPKAMSAVTQERLRSQQQRPQRRSADSALVPTAALPASLASSEQLLKTADQVRAHMHAIQAELAWLQSESLKLQQQQQQQSPQSSSSSSSLPAFGTTNSATSIAATTPLQLPPLAPIVVAAPPSGDAAEPASVSAVPPVAATAVPVIAAPIDAVSIPPARPSPAPSAATSEPVVEPATAAPSGLAALDDDCTRDSTHSSDRPVADSIDRDDDDFAVDMSGQSRSSFSLDDRNSAAAARQLREDLDQFHAVQQKQQDSDDDDRDPHASVPPPMHPVRKASSPFLLDSPVTDDDEDDCTPFHMPGAAPTLVWPHQALEQEQQQQQSEQAASSSASSAVLPALPTRMQRRASQLDLSAFHSHFEHEPAFASVSAGRPRSQSMGCSPAASSALRRSSPQSANSKKTRGIVRFEDEKARQAREAAEESLRNEMAEQHEQDEAEGEADEDETSLSPETTGSVEANERTESQHAMEPAAGPAAPLVYPASHRVRLSLSCQSLPFSSRGTTRDTLVVAQLKLPSGALREIGRTELVRNSRNPQFQTLVELEHTPLRRQVLKFSLYDLPEAPTMGLPAAATSATTDASTPLPLPPDSARIGHVRLLADHLVLPGHHSAAPRGFASGVDALRAGVGHERLYEIQHEKAAQNASMQGSHMSFLYESTSLMDEEADVAATAHGKHELEQAAPAAVSTPVARGTAAAIEPPATPLTRKPAPFSFSPLSPTAAAVAAAASAAAAAPSAGPPTPFCPPAPRPSNAHFGARTPFDDDDSLRSVSPAHFSLMATPSPAVAASSAVSAPGPPRTPFCDDSSSSSPAKAHSLLPAMQPPTPFDHSELMSDSSSAAGGAAAPIPTIGAADWSLLGQPGLGQHASPSHSAASGSKPVRSPSSSETRSIFSSSLSPSPTPLQPLNLLNRRSSSGASSWPFAVAAAAAVAASSPSPSSAASNSAAAASAPPSAAAAAPTAALLPSASTTANNSSSSDDPSNQLGSARHSSNASFNNDDDAPSSAAAPVSNVQRKLQLDADTPLASMIPAAISAPSSAESRGPLLSSPALQRLVFGVAVQKLSRGAVFGPSTKTVTLRLVQGERRKSAIAVDPSSPSAASDRAGSYRWSLRWSGNAAKSFPLCAGVTVEPGVTHGVFAAHAKRRRKFCLESQEPACFSVMASTSEAAAASSSTSSARSSLDVVCGSTADCVECVSLLRSIIASQH